MPAEPEERPPIAEDAPVDFLEEAARFDRNPKVRVHAIDRLLSQFQLEALQHVAEYGLYKDAIHGAIGNLRWFLGKSQPLARREVTEWKSLLQNALPPSVEKRRPYEHVLERARKVRKPLTDRQRQVLEKLKAKSDITHQQRMRLLELELRAEGAPSPRDIAVLARDLAQNLSSASDKMRFVELAYRRMVPPILRKQFEDRAADALRRIGGYSKSEHAAYTAIGVLAMNKRYWDLSRIGRHSPDKNLREKVLNRLVRRQRWGEIHSMAAHSHFGDTRAQAFDLLLKHSPEHVMRIAARTSFEDVARRALEELVRKKDYATLREVFLRTKFPKLRAEVVQELVNANALNHLAYVTAHTDDEAAARLAMSSLQPGTLRRVLRGLTPEQKRALEFVRDHAFLKSIRESAEGLVGKKPETPPLAE
jgi:hypothetical protein